MSKNPLKRLLHYKKDIRRSPIRLPALWLVLVLLPSAAVGEKAAFQPLYPLCADAPALTAEGLLSEDAEQSYYLLMDDETGEWAYVDQQMFIHIRRFQDVVEKERNLVWYETEVKTAPGTKFVTQHANPEQIGRRFRVA